MLTITSSSCLETLARSCATTLSTRLDDPFAPEWIAVPTGGVQAWLERRLAGRLGTSADGRRDGISMNIRFSRASGLRRELLGLGTSYRSGDGDDWSITAMTWTLMAIGADPGAVDRHLEIPLSRWAQWHATRFARYQVHRPEVIREWLIGASPTGPLSGTDDAGLYRALHARIATRDPVETLDSVLNAISDGSGVPHDIPERLVFFGFPTIPDGSGFIRLLESIAPYRDMHLFLLSAAPTTPPQRWPDLTRSWAGLDVQTRQLVAPIVATMGNGVVQPDSVVLSRHGSHLDRLQQHLKGTSVAPSAANPADRSVVVHDCQGMTRQVEVLRDDLLGRLADDDTLHEEDIVVYCADLDGIAPIIESVLGRPGRTDSGATTPGLRYHVDGRSPRSTDSTTGAFLQLLELATGRVTSVDILTFCQHDAVMRRWGFDDSDIGVFRGWVSDLNVRWGLDAAHRARFGLPEALTLGTWRRAIDRLALGIACATNEPVDFPTGQVDDPIAPFGIEGDDISRLGRLSDLLGRVDELARGATEPIDITKRLEMLRVTVRNMLAPPPGQEYELEQILMLCSVPDDVADVDGPGFAVDLATLNGFLGEQVVARQAGSGAVRGGITVAGPGAFVGVPFRVTALLGFDDTWVPTGSVDATDLVSRTPRAGDPDPKGEARLALFHAIASTRDALVVLRNGRDVTTNKRLPHGVLVSELFEALGEVIGNAEESPARRRDDAIAALVTEHPRQATDPRCFTPGALGSGLPTRPFSFDAVAFGAVAADTHVEPAGGRIAETPRTRVTHPHETISIAGLTRLLRDPTKYLCRNVLDVRLPYERAEPTEHLPTALDALERYGVSAQILEMTLGESPTNRPGGDEIEARLRAEDRLPVAGLGNAALAKAIGTVDALLDLYDAATGGRTPETVSVDVGIPDGRSITGSLDVWRDGSEAMIIDVRASKLTNGDRISALAKLVALAASDRSLDWHAVLITPKHKKPVRLTIPSVSGPADHGDDVDAFIKTALSTFAAFFDVARLGLAPLLADLYKLDGGFAAPSTRSTTWKTEFARHVTWRYVYGYTDLTDLLAQAVHPDDPGMVDPGDPDGPPSPSVGRVEYLGRQVMGLLGQADAFAKAARKR